MKFFRLIEKAFRALLPSPLSIAILLTVVTFVIAFFTMQSDVTGMDRAWNLVTSWEQGLWGEPWLKFAFQMMLMLVLGHVLALTKPVDFLVSRVTQYCNSTATSAAIVTVLTVAVALFNWGLGLIFGAILARKVGEHAVRNNIPLNYPIIGAAGYSGLMVWHGGISGSAPIKAAEPGHIKEFMSGIYTPEQIAELPNRYSFSETIFGGMNLTAIVLLLVLLPLFMYWMGKRSEKAVSLPRIRSKEDAVSSDFGQESSENSEGAERIDASKWFAMGIGLLIVWYLVFRMIEAIPIVGFGFITPDFINLFLLGLGLLLHRSIRSFLKAVNDAIGGASGILIQFPLYFGILGIMKYSGLIGQISDFFSTHSSQTTFPIYTFLSSGLVNIFVPSGGGQWTIQGPIIIEAAANIGVSAPKAIMALAYGDQVTNMLQPFWALPLLGITGLKARDILPYTFALMLVGSIIFLTVLMIF
ncbi:MAG: TIGR00366 family protein [bacterium]|nr:TIGR00366 family protein [bacterium]